MELKDILAQRRLERQKVSADTTHPKAETSDAVYQHATWAPEESRAFYALFEGIEEF